MASASVLPARDTEPFLWRRLRRLKGRLRIGVLLRSGMVDAWVGGVLRCLIEDPAVRLEVVLVPDGPRAGKLPVLVRGLRIWSRRVADSEAPVDPQVLLEGIEQVRIEEPLRAEDRHAIAARNLDVLMALGNPAGGRARLEGDCSGLTRLGVWSFSLGDPVLPAVRPAFWGEVFDQQPLTKLVLLRHRQRFEEASVLHEHVSATQQGWFPSRNRLEPCRMAGRILLRRLHDALEFGDVLGDGRASLRLDRRPARFP